MVLPTLVKKIVPFKMYIIVALVLGVSGLLAYKFYEVSKLETSLANKDIELTAKDVEIKGYEYALERTGTELNKILVSNKSKDEFIKQREERHKKDMQLLKEAHKDDLKREVKIATIKERIKNVKPSEDAPTAPILFNTIDSLFSKNKN